MILTATDWPADLTRALAGLRATSPIGTSVVIVADGPSPEQEAALEQMDAATSGDSMLVEVIWMSERSGLAAAANVGLRRAIGPIAILLDSSLEPTGDVVSPIVRALQDPTVAITGGWGIVSTDLRTFEDAPAGDVEVILGQCQAFRRADYTERGPLDEHLRIPRTLDIWWSLVLRERSEGESARRALRLDGLPISQHEHRGLPRLSDAERHRQSKRDFYRILDRFGDRRDLRVRPGGPQARP